MPNETTAILVKNGETRNLAADDPYLLELLALIENVQGVKLIPVEAD